MVIDEFIEYDVEIHEKIYKFLIRVNGINIDTIMCIYEKSVFRFDDDRVFEIEKGAYALLLKDGYYYVGSYPYTMSKDYTKLTKEIIRDKEKLKQRLEEIATNIDKERAEYEEKRNKK